MIQRRGAVKVLLYSAIPLGDRGGVQNVMLGLAAALPRRGIEAALAGPDADVEAGGERIVLETDVAAGGRPSPAAMARAAVSLLRLARVLARTRPDVVNLHFLTGEAAYFVALRRLFRYRLLLSLHGSDLMATPPTLAPYLDRLLNAADAATVVSAALRERVLGAVSPERLSVIPNGIDAGFWTPGPVCDRRRGRVVAVGRLAPVKGFDVLIAALEHLPEAELVVIGEGETRAALAAQAQALGVADRVSLPGHLDREPLRAALRRADVFGTDRFRPELLRPVREALAAPREPRRKVFVSRGGASRRRLLEEEAIWPMLARAGFERVAMEALRFADQISLMSETRILMAPHGAGLANMMFCPEGAEVVEIADPAFPNPNFYALASAMGHRHWWVRGDGVGGGRPPSARRGRATGPRSPRCRARAAASAGGRTRPSSRSMSAISPFPPPGALAWRGCSARRGGEDLRRAPGFRGAGAAARVYLRFSARPYTEIH